mmetsp:Transcript_38961/g.57267  ORF Transcript_38961/g.57267 Transcript_38961/m.57267 type:complete len:288 (-) Transcript_38961:51-914(-)
MCSSMSGLNLAHAFLHPLLSSSQFGKLRKLSPLCLAPAHHGKPRCVFTAQRALSESHSARICFEAHLQNFLQLGERMLQSCLGPNQIHMDFVRALLGDGGNSDVPGGPCRRAGRGACTHTATKQVDPFVQCVQTQASLCVGALANVLHLAPELRGRGRGCLGQHQHSIVPVWQVFLGLRKSTLLPTGHPRARRGRKCGALSRLQLKQAGRRVRGAIFDHAVGPGSVMQEAHSKQGTVALEHVEAVGTHLRTRTPRRESRHPLLAAMRSCRPSIGRHWHRRIVLQAQV